MHTDVYYQGIRNDSFSENFACVLKEWFLKTSQNLYIETYMALNLLQTQFCIILLHKLFLFTTFWWVVAFFGIYIVFCPWLSTLSWFVVYLRAKKKFQFLQNINRAKKWIHSLHSPFCFLQCHIKNLGKGQLI